MKDSDRLEALHVSNGSVIHLMAITSPEPAPQTEAASDASPPNNNHNQNRGGNFQALGEQARTEIFSQYLRRLSKIELTQGILLEIESRTRGG